MNIFLLSEHRCVEVTGNSYICFPNFCIYNPGKDEIFLLYVLCFWKLNDIITDQTQQLFQDILGTHL